MRNLGSINESEDIVTKDYADQKLPGRPITKYDYDHLSPAEKDADIVYFIIDDDQDALEFDEVPTAGSDNPVKSKGIKAALDAKQNTLTFDQTPTAGSQNPVTSGGVKSALNTLTGRARRDISSDLSNLATAVAEQNLAKYGYAIGDYFTGPSGYKYILADLDTFYGGYNISAVLGTHHITLVVDTDQNVKWNSSDSTTTGYAGSNLHTYMVNTVLPNVKTDITSLFGAWADHLLSHQKLYSTNTASWAWSSGQYISALTSVQFHGSPICDMNFYHTGEGNKPLEVFQRFFYVEIFGQFNVWLRSVASASCPCLAAARGHADGASASSESFGAVGLIIFH